MKVENKLESRQGQDTNVLCLLKEQQDEAILDVQSKSSIIDVVNSNRRYKVGAMGLSRLQIRVANKLNQCPEISAIPMYIPGK
jgi:hypothetical protein